MDRPNREAARQRDRKRPGPAREKHARDQVRTTITNERQRESFVGQKRRGHADVDCGLQSYQRNNTTAEEQTKPILGVQCDHVRNDGRLNERHVERAGLYLQQRTAEKNGRDN